MVKRELICEGCYEKAKEFLMPSPPGEHHLALHGRAKASYVCDHCIKPIVQGAECVALSIWSESLLYYSWEHELVYRSGELNALERKGT